MKVAVTRLLLFAIIANSNGRTLSKQGESLILNAHKVCFNNYYLYLEHFALFMWSYTGEVCYKNH